VVVQALFKSFGCTAAIASGSIATTLVVGRTIEEAGRLTNLEVVQALGACPNRRSSARFWPSRRSRRRCDGMTRR